MIKRFLQQHPLEDMERDEAILTEGKTLLLLQYQLDGTYKRLSRKGGIIYAIEVSGINGNNIKYMKQDAMTDKVVRFSAIDKLFKHKMTAPTDTSYRKLTQRVNSMTPKQVYEELVTISNRGGER